MCERYVAAIHCSRCHEQFAWRAQAPPKQCRGFIEWFGCDGTVIPRWEHVLEGVCYKCLMASIHGEWYVAV